MTGRRWRADIQGLRALAVMGVVVYHAGASWLPGGFAGVDVFFVISGFLITGNLLREHATTGQVRLAAFCGNRIVRLAPAATVTVLLTTVAAVLALPPLDRPGLRLDAIASLFGVENLWLAWTGTDYLANHDASPFQQFWSLGVEEQFYVFWALTLVGVLAVRRLRRHLVIVVSALVGVSAVVMVVIGSSSMPWAFFSVPARAWEFGIGALVAVLGARIGTTRPRPVLGALVPLTGLALIAVSYVLLSEATPYPGPATLLPVLGAALVVLPIGSDSVVGRALATPVLAWIGNRSYSIYLLHWPIMVIPVLAWGRPLTLVEALIAIALTVAMGWMSHAALEVRLARWVRSATARRRAVSRFPSPSTRRTGGLIGVVGAVAVICLAVTTLPQLHAAPRIGPPTAAMIRAGASASTIVPANATPTLDAASDSLSPLYSDGCQADFAATTTRACSFGSGNEVVVLFGDSHAAQWFSPLRAWAAQHGKRLVTMTKSSCPSADIPIRSADLGREYGECDVWRADAMRKIVELRPQAVFLASASNLDGPLTSNPAEYRQEWQSALERTISRIQQSGAAAVVVQDTPSWSTAPNRALSASVDDAIAVSQPRASLVDPRARAAERAAARSTGSLLVDPIDWLCTERCAPVLWNLVAYRDANHLTEPMADALLPRWDDALQELQHQST